MGKRGSLNNIVYGIFFALVGVLAFSILVRLGNSLDANKEEEQNVVRNIALLLDAYQILPGNIEVRTNYDMQDKTIKLEPTRVGIFDVADEIIQGRYEYRFAGTNILQPSLFTSPDFINLIKGKTVGVNEPFSTELLDCVYGPNPKYESVQMLYTDDYFFTLETEEKRESDFTKPIAENILTNIKDRFPHIISWQLTNMNDFTKNAVELKIAISTKKQKGAPNDIFVYVPYKRRDLQQLACEIVNDFILDENIQFNDAIIKMVNVGTNIDDSSTSGTTRVMGDMIYFELGNIALHSDSVADNIFSWQYYISKIMTSEILPVLKKAQ